MYWRTGCHTARYGDGVNDITTGGRVMRATPDGVISVLAEGRCGYVGGLYHDETHVYWTENATIERVPLAGGSPTVHTQELIGGAAWDLSGDDDWIYAVAASGPCGFIFKIPKTGGSLVPLAGQQHGPNRIAVDGSHVDWLNLGLYDQASASLVGGSLRRAPKSQ